VIVNMTSGTEHSLGFADSASARRRAIPRV
jgi:hypothetical protein